MVEKQISWKLVMTLNKETKEEFDIPHDWALKAIMAQAEPYTKGNVTTQRRLEVLARDMYTCQSCGINNENIPLQVHHINEEVLGGSAEMYNLVTLCWKCHNLQHAAKRNMIIK